MHAGFGIKQRSFSFRIDKMIINTQIINEYRELL